MTRAEELHSTSIWYYNCKVRLLKVKLVTCRISTIKDCVVKCMIYGHLIYYLLWLLELKKLLITKLNQSLQKHLVYWLRYFHIKDYNYFWFRLITTFFIWLRKLIIKFQKTRPFMYFLNNLIFNPNWYINTLYLHSFGYF